MAKTLLKKALGSAAVLALAGVGVSAQAASVGSVLGSGPYLLSDNSAEYLINGDPQDTDTTVDVGDRLRGIFTIDTVQPNDGSSPATSIGGTSSVNELTAIFDITVTDKTTFNGSTCLQAFCWTFGTTASFAAEAAAAGFTNTDGAMVMFFEDSANDFERLLQTGDVAGDIAAMEASATGGNPFWLFGDDGGTEFFWNAGGNFDDISIAEILPANTSFGNFNTGLLLLEAIAGPQLGDVACTDLTSLAITTVNACGNGQLLSKGPTGVSGSFASSYDSLDDVNFTVNIVPAPGSLALIALGLLGLTGVSRRARK